MSARYSAEVRAKSVRLFREHSGDYPSEWAAMRAISGRMGMNAETLRHWVRQAEVDQGQAAGVTTESAKEVRELKRKVSELERTIGILKAASAFFARECYLLLP